MSTKENHSPWLDWAVELQALAQTGLTYTKDVFDKERFERIRAIAVEMLSHQTDIPKETVKTLFAGETGYPTPKIDTRAAVFQDNKILLVKENGKWALPGGWVDATETIYSNTAKEVKEEAGLDVRPVRLIALLDRNKHNMPRHAYNICTVYVLCQLEGGHFAPNNETQASGFFEQDNLPPLSQDKTTAEQIALCFAAAQDEHWQVQFD